MKKFLVLVFSLSLFLGLNGCGGSNNPEKVALSFYKNLANGKIDAAMELLHFDETGKMEKEKMRQMLVASAEELKKEGKKVKIVSKGVTYSDDKQRATVRLATSRDDEGKVELVKTKKGWKVVLRYF